LEAVSYGFEREKTGEKPVLLFDDILSELDENRKQYVLSGIKDRQVIMTTCEAHWPIVRAVKEEVRIMRVKNGTYEPCMYT